MIDVPHKTSAGCNWIPIESLLLSEGKLFIRGEITSDTADEFVQELMHVTGSHFEGDLHMYIDSPGGEVNAGLLIYDTLKSLKCNYDITCIGTASSMESIILEGGRKGCRHILPHSSVMIHELLIPGGVGGSATSIKKAAESIMKTKNSLPSCSPGTPEKASKKWKKAISFANYMTAAEAVTFGIADNIVTDIL